MLKIACLTAVLVLALAQSASAGLTPFVVGSGTGPIPLPGYEGQTLHADVAAVQLGGGFHVVHRLADGGLFGEAWGSVDCLRTAGRTAFVTGTIVVGTAPGQGIADIAGHRVALTVTDGRPDVFEFDISTLHGDVPPRQAIPPCARGAVPISTAAGGFVVG